MPTPPARSIPPRPSLAVPLVLLLLLAGLFWQAWPAGTDSLHDPDARARPVALRGPLTTGELSTIDVFERNKECVVSISTHSPAGGRRLRVRTPRQVEQGTGSGIIWDRTGYIVTNHHVLEGAQRATVILAGGEKCEGYYVGGDPAHDLAVLKIEPPRQLRAVELGSSRDLRIGQSVLAIGNPFGLEWTLTTGVVSGLDRVIESIDRHRIEGVIQTDAAINPGNSGGPLLDSAGRLIGIVTAIYAPPSGTSAGISFAVSADLMNDVVPDIIRYGVPSRAGLGILMFPDSSTRHAGLEGVAIEEVTPGSAAERAGLRSYASEDGSEAVDVIVAVDEQPVRSQEDLRRLLGGRQVGDVVQLSVQRGDGAVTVEVVLQDVR